MDPNIRHISQQQTDKLNSYTGLNKNVKFKNKNKNGQFLFGKVVDEVSLISFDYKYVLQRIELAPSIAWDSCRYACRIGYYTWDRKMKKVVWGQYHALPSETEMQELLTKMRAKGWFTL